MSRPLFVGRYLQVTSWTLSQWKGGKNPSNDNVVCFVSLLWKDLDPCRPNPCLNSGACLHTDDGYICNCSTRFKGRHCQGLYALSLTHKNIASHRGFSLVFTFMTSCNRSHITSEVKWRLKKKLYLSSSLDGLRIFKNRVWFCLFVQEQSVFNLIVEGLFVD